MRNPFLLLGGRAEGSGRAFRHRLRVVRFETNELRGRGIYRVRVLQYPVNSTSVLHIKPVATVPIFCYSVRYFDEQWSDISDEQCPLIFLMNSP